jgi:DNA (cytosine-5)-methyltransferase 1
MFLDLNGPGNLLGLLYWEILSPWRGGALMLNTGVSPREEKGSSLLRILQAEVPRKYYLTKTACLGILRRAAERGKQLSSQLKLALMMQAGQAQSQTDPDPPLAFRINQREEAIDLGETASTLMATSNMQMQTFVTQQPKALCLNDQGGKVMNCTEDMTGTLRAEAHSHQPLVFENHCIDARYTGPHRVSPTLTARGGTGGNNLPLVAEVATPTYQQTVGTLTSSDRKWPNAQYVDQEKLAEDSPLLIRRLTPLECERLQGFPDGWTDIPGASDSARYKALGNSVAIPCVEYVMHGIAIALQEAA